MNIVNAGMLALLPDGSAADPFASDPDLEAAIIGTGGGSTVTPGTGGPSATTPGGGGDPSVVVPGAGPTLQPGDPGFIGPLQNNPNVFDLNQLAPQNGSTDRILNNALNYSAGIALVVAMFFIIYGGYQVMMAGDNPSKFESGVKTIKYTIIGLLVIFLSAAIVNFVAENILNVRIN